MSVPYGAWMGSVIQDSFHPPHELCVEIQRFLADHEALFSPKTCSETAVVYSVETEFLRESGRGIFADNRYNQDTSEIGPFWGVCEALSDAAQPYDVLFFPDGNLRPDTSAPGTLTPGTLSQYRTIILPDCRSLTSAQSRLLLDYMEKDGHLLIIGELGTNLPPAERKLILQHRGAKRTEDVAGFDPEWLAFGPQVRLSTSADLAIHLQQVESGIAIHILQYDYDSQRDEVPLLDRLDLEIRLPENYRHLQIFSPGEPPHAQLTVSGDVYHLALEKLPLYSILLLSK
jgi:hypothetical protein